MRVVNPRGHRAAVDCVEGLVVRKGLGRGKGGEGLGVEGVGRGRDEGREDERILARMISGFFGGWVFGLERSFFRLGGWRYVPVGYEDG